MTAASLVYFVAVGMLIPVLPLYVEGPLGGGDVAVGATVGAFSLAAAVLRPAIGRLGDRSGRRLLVMGGAAVVAGSVPLYGLADTLPALLALRLVTGAGEAALFVGAATAIQDLAPDDRRGEAASYFSVAIYGGLALGPALGEWILDGSGFGGVWLVAALSCAVAVVLGWWTPEPPASQEPPSHRRLFHPAALGPGSVLGLALIGFAGFSTFVPLYVDDIGVNGSKSVFGLYAAIVLAVRIFGARIPDVVGRIRAASTALSLLIVALGLLAVWQAPAGLYTGTVLYATGSSLLFPSLMSLVVDVAPESERSSAISTFSLFFDLAQGVGALLLGAVVAVSSEPVAFGVSSGLSAVALYVLRTRVSALPRQAVGGR